MKKNKKIQINETEDKQWVEYLRTVIHYYVIENQYVIKNEEANHVDIIDKEVMAGPMYPGRNIMIIQTQDENYVGFITWPGLSSGTPVVMVSLSIGCNIPGKYRIAKKEDLNKYKRYFRVLKRYLDLLKKLDTMQNPFPEENKLPEFLFLTHPKGCEWYQVWRHIKKMHSLFFDVRMSGYGGCGHDQWYWKNIKAEFDSKMEYWKSLALIQWEWAKREVVQIKSRCSLGDREYRRRKIDILDVKIINKGGKKYLILKEKSIYGIETLKIEIIFKGQWNFHYWGLEIPNPEDIEKMNQFESKGYKPLYKNDRSDKMPFIISKEWINKIEEEPA